MHRFLPQGEPSQSSHRVALLPLSIHRPAIEPIRHEVDRAEWGR
ncbi:MAG: hypothetical protein ACLQU5_33660 [Isosphaeraceae bacterium]